MFIPYIKSTDLFPANYFSKHQSLSDHHTGFAMQILIPQNLPIGYAMEYSQYHNTSKQQTKKDTSRESNQVEEETQKLESSDFQGKYRTFRVSAITYNGKGKNQRENR